MKLHVKIDSISSVFKFQHAKEIVFNAYKWDFLGALNCIAAHYPLQVKPIKYLNRAYHGLQPACLSNLTISRFPTQMSFSKFASLSALRLYAVVFLDSVFVCIVLSGTHASFPPPASWLTAFYESSRSLLLEIFSDTLFGNKHIKRHLPRLLGVLETRTTFVTLSLLIFISH